MKIFFCALAVTTIQFLGLAPADHVFADDSFVKSSEKLVFADDFERGGTNNPPDQIGRGWRTNAHEPWSLAPGQTQIRSGAVEVTPADGMLPKVIVYRYTHYFDGRVEFRLKLPGESDQVGLVIADNSLKDVHAGHVLSVRMRAGEIIMADMVSGAFDPEIHRRKQLQQLTSQDRDQISSCRKTIPANIEVGAWNDIAIETTNQLLEVRLNGKPVGEFESKGFGNRKTEFRITIPRFGIFDDFKHVVTDQPETSVPRHLLITKRFEDKFDSLGATEAQRRRLNELSLAHRRSVLGLRERVGIDREMIRARDEAFRQAKQQGLEGRDIWSWVKTQAELTDLQTEAFRVTQERHEQFKAEAMHLLTPTQRAALRKQNKSASQKGKDTDAS